MQKKFKIIIKKINYEIQSKNRKSCSEKFDKFTPTEKDGFCNSCQKEVIDFTGMSSKDILEYFKNNTGNTCGHFSKYQLDETYKDFEKPKFRFVKNIGIVSLFSFSTIQSQTEKPKIEVNSDINKKTVSTGEFIISGTVYDEYLECFEGAIVRLKNTELFTKTNSEGEFTFPHPLETNQVLVFFGEGFSEEEIKITNQEEISLVLKELPLINGMVYSGEVQTKEILNSSKKKGFWRKKKK